MGLVTLLGLVAGVVAFGLVTRPLRRLTEAMRKFDARGAPAQPPLPSMSATHTADARENERDEIAAATPLLEDVQRRLRPPGGRDVAAEPAHVVRFPPSQHEQSSRLPGGASSMRRS